MGNYFLASHHYVRIKILTNIYFDVVEIYESLKKRYRAFFVHTMLRYREKVFQVAAFIL